MKNTFMSMQDCSRVCTSTQQTPEWLFWSRDEFINSTYDFGKRVIYGHTPHDKPKIDANKIGIDTGRFMAVNSYLSRFAGK